MAQFFISAVRKKLFNRLKKNYFMKKTCLIGAALILFLEGSLMLEGCKNNTPGYTKNDSSVSTEPTTSTASTGSDTFNSGLSRNDSSSLNGTNGVAGNTSSINTTDTGTSRQTSSSYSGYKEKSTSDNGCNLPARRHRIAATTHHKVACARVAYKPKHKVYCGHVARTKTKKVECNEVVKNNTPEPAPVAEITQPQDTNKFEKQSEFTGNVTTTKTTTTVQKRSMLHFAPEVGFNLNNMYKTADDYQTSNMLKVGFHAGIMLDAALSDHSYIQPTLRYIMKGAEITGTSSDPFVTVERKDKLTLHYIELPVDYVYKFGAPGTTRFMIGVGPYIAYLANAQDKSKVTTSYFDGPTVVSEGQHSVPVGHSDQTGNMKSLDWGGNAFIGLEGASGLYVKAGGELGLIDLQQNTIGGKYYNRNYNFLLSVGYLLGNNR
jgi:hypothetical protein